MVYNKVNGRYSLVSYLIEMPVLSQYSQLPGTAMYDNKCQRKAQNKLILIHIDIWFEVMVNHTACDIAT